MLLSSRMPRKERSPRAGSVRLVDRGHAVLQRPDGAVGRSVGIGAGDAFRIDVGDVGAQRGVVLGRGQRRGDRLTGELLGLVGPDRHVLDLPLRVVRDLAGVRVDQRGLRRPAAVRRRRTLAADGLRQNLRRRLGADDVGLNVGRAVGLTRRKLGMPYGQSRRLVAGVLEHVLGDRVVQLALVPAVMPSWPHFTGTVSRYAAMLCRRALASIKALTGRW